MTKPATDEEIDAIKLRLAQAEQDYIIWGDGDISMLLARIHEEVEARKVVEAQRDELLERWRTVLATSRDK